VERGVDAKRYFNTKKSGVRSYAEKISLFIQTIPKFHPKNTTIPKKVLPHYPKSKILYPDHKYGKPQK
jgi:hypothetical protein